ncbi:MAG: hypothetical protein K0S36_1835 [Nitrosospira multiformis]|jgi:hypothetical protein|nr:hypothetical protein [Nitrosospira multiformis]
MPPGSFIWHYAPPASSSLCTCKILELLGTCLCYLIAVLRGGLKSQVQIKRAERGSLPQVLHWGPEGAIPAGTKSKESLNKSSAVCVAVKIAMITRRATKVVACAFTCYSDAKEREEVAPQSESEDSAKRMGQCRSVTTAQDRIWSAGIPLRGCIFLWKPLLLSPRSSLFVHLIPQSPPLRPRGIYSAVPKERDR